MSPAQTAVAARPSLVVTRTPLRVSLFGGGTDLPEYSRQYGGAVLSFGIDKYVYVTAKPRWDGRVAVNLGEREEVASAEEVTHPLARECLLAAGVDRGIEVTVCSDVPPGGSGLGSSSSLTVGLLAALGALRGRAPDRYELAAEACRIEIDVLGEPIGKQDQFAAAHGGCHEYRFRRDGGVDVLLVEFDGEPAEEFSRHAVLLFTGRTRRASSVLADQRRRVPDTTGYLHRLKDMVSEGRALVAEGDMPALGDLLDEAWQTKRALSDLIHDPELDGAYRAALDAGAYGGKLLGAGGGGFFLFLCPPSRRDAVLAALPRYQRMPVVFGVPGGGVLSRHP